MARRVAEAFAYQGFVRGTGTGPTADYEGCVCVLGIGDTAREHAIPDVPTLMTHPYDAVVADNFATGANGTNCWYNAAGVVAVTAWIEDFLDILKDEFDNPLGGEPLCYPTHFAFDLEYALPLVWFAINRFDPPGPGWWTWALDDPRFSTEVLIPGPVDQTMDDIVAGAPGIPNQAVSWSNSANQPFTNWFVGITQTIVSVAMRRAIYDAVNDRFPEAKVSNYNTFVADNPNYPFWEAVNDWGAYTVDDLRADAQAPAYYGPSMYDGGGQFNGRKGAGESQFSFWRRFLRHQIEAFRLSSNPLPNTPWIPAPGLEIGQRDPDPGYVVTGGDFQWLLRNCGRAGIDEFIVFAAGVADETNAGAKRLSKAVRHCQASIWPRRPFAKWFWR